NDYEEANQKILALIPLDAIVGIGDSTGIRQLGTLQALKERGTIILDPFQPKRVNAEIGDNERWRLRVEATLSDVYLTGTNAITQDGRLVNVDGTGNRVAGMFWGHPLSIIVVGINKIVQNLDEAFHRTRNIIAPNHLRIRSVELGGRKRKTPCVVTGECNDCRSEDRGCNVFTIIEGKPSRTNINVILVNQDIGLGWDPSWPQERIAKIIAEYKKFAWEGGELPAWSRKSETR
ncbi:MAG: lactate utilization protein, partial [Thermodesulfobacteriota bacterium]|nr:lactate utilization protein [Thermodesulfobacteriota bacterium]